MNGKTRLKRKQNKRIPKKKIDTRRKHDKNFAYFVFEKLKDKRIENENESKWKRKRKTLMSTQAKK